MPSTGRTMQERFALPYSFKPNLSVWEAFIAAVVGFLRIFFGSVLFAFWGVYSLVAIERIPNIFLRTIAAVFLIALFLAVLAALMLAITGVARRLCSGPKTQT